MTNSIVKQPSKPVCVHCGTECGTKFHTWPAHQLHKNPWDGSSWFHPYNPFCTLRCALSFARKAYAKHGLG